jgi:predicted metal-binding protein
MTTALESGHSPVVVTVCATCRREGTAREAAEGAALHAAVAALGRDKSGIVVRTTQCLSVCKRVCTVAISGSGRYSYLFGDLAPDTDAAAVIAMAEACRDAAFGFVPWKARPEPLRKGTIARLPPPEWSPSDGSAPA